MQSVGPSDSQNTSTEAEGEEEEEEEEEAVQEATRSFKGPGLGTGGLWVALFPRSGGGSFLPGSEHRSLPVGTC
ncbi:hypothetical protein SKAU_G00004140 [Synaphobranchus kaupii]|uniref:Uncharacterized protein n=1 Tax=Synaphobranchus kaupii TaxID=118154 RepID=A0A9Q1G8R9_SYNKA|nr:hypothetical protein SKAU_G00004140 [Synaphobranchus kaupii]